MFFGYSAEELHESYKLMRDHIHNVFEGIVWRELIFLSVLFEDGKHVIIVNKVNMICINKEFKGFLKNELSMYYLERIIDYIIFVNSTSVLKIK